MFVILPCDDNPGAGNIKYQVIVTIENPPTNKLGTVNLSANQPATGVVSGTVNWSNILNKPNLSFVGHTHSAAEITSGTLATAQGGTGRTDGKVTALATPRTLTLGNTGKNFDGSANVSWTHTELGTVRNFGTVAVQALAGDTNITTAQFIGWLNNIGALNQPSVMKCNWSYAGNNDISDTGFGMLELAGCVIETFPDGGTYIIRVTSPATGTGAGGIHEYQYQGPEYSPGWRRVYTSTLNGDVTGNAATANSLVGFNNPTAAATANTIAYRDGSADVNARLFRSNYGDQASISGAMAFRVNNSSDNYIRFCSNTAAIRTWMGADNASNLTLGTLADARLPGIFSKKTIIKDAIGTGSGDYHLELRSSDIGGGGDVALMFHQSNRWYHSIRANANGFRFTNGGSNNLERLTAGAYYFGDNGGHMGAGAGSSMRVQTPTGYVDVGSTNAGWAHFSTDRPGYYFNRSIHVDGELQIYNTGTGFNSLGLFWDSGATTLYKLATGAISIGTTNAGAVDKMLHFGYTPIDGYGFRFLHQGHASNAAAGTFSLQRGLVNSWADVLTVDNGGTLAINNMQVRLRAVTDSHHYLAYVNVAAGGWIVDGPELVGSSGGRLGTSDGNSALYWGKNKRVYLNEWLEFTSGGHIGLYWSSHGSQLQCEGGGRYTFQGGSDIGIHLSDGSGNKQGIIYAAGRNVGFLIPDLVGWALRVDAGGNAYANDFIATSDRRIKSELEVIPNALDKVSKMTGYTYMKKGNDTRRQAGYIAQDLQAVLPEGVFEYDDVLQVSNSATIGLLLNAVNELSAEVKELKRRLH